MKKIVTAYNHIMIVDIFHWSYVLKIDSEDYKLTDCTENSQHICHLYHGTFCEQTLHPYFLLESFVRLQVLNMITMGAKIVLMGMATRDGDEDGCNVCSQYF